MKSNRLGCLTGTGIAAAFLTLFALAGVAFASGGQMFTAGPLNDQPGEMAGGVVSHAQIDSCGACHAPFWSSDAMADRCLACHVDIADEMRTVAELHGIVTLRSPQLACRDCHPEHRGKTASLTELGENQFPHETFGYSLTAHQQTRGGSDFACSDCHGDDIKIFDPGTCLSCHREMDVVFSQIHLISFGEDCLACHDGVDSYGDDFDHDRFSFQLTGGHAAVDCAQCHILARSIADLRSAPQDCFSCHSADDAHDGRYGTECSVCHNSTSWENATFDHSRTLFPLTGGHAGIECERCHQNGVYQGLDATCVSCHAEPESHFGQFGTDCAACHSTSAWKPASYNGPHTFPMEHEGANGQCSLCHPNSLTTYTCYGCHEHNPSRIAQEHREEGISNFENCVECHADGREHEGGDD